MEIVSYRGLDHTFLPLRGGVNSRCYTDGHLVVKLVAGGKDEQATQRMLQLLRGEYQLFKEYLGDYVLESEFFASCDQEKWIVRIEQDFASGYPLRQSLKARNPAVYDFFQRNLHLYRQKGVVPDLLPDIMYDPSGGMMLTGKFTYRSGPNVFIVEGKPLLVDSTLNKSLRNKIYGVPLKAMLVWRIKSLLQDQR